MLSQLMAQRGQRNVVISRSTKDNLDYFSPPLRMDIIQLYVIAFIFKYDLSIQVKHSIYIRHVLVGKSSHKQLGIRYLIDYNQSLTSKRLGPKQGKFIKDRKCTKYRIQVSLHNDGPLCDFWSHYKLMGHFAALCLSIQRWTTLRPISDIQ